MLEEDEGPAEAAIGFTDQFVDAGAAKLDALFGAGYAKGNPQALAAYVAACASNLHAFMTIAATLGDDASLDEALADLEDELLLRPAPKPKRRGR